MANKKIGFLFTVKDNTKAAFNSVKKGLDGIGSAAKKVGQLVVGVGAAATGAALAFGALVMKTTDYIDNLGKVSQVTGVSTSLLQKFRFAAEQAGVTGDNAALAIRRFSRRLGEAARGSGELKPALDKLGISVFNVDGTTKSAEKVLMEFADGLANVKNDSERLAFAFKGFDSEGAELVATLAKGSAGLEEMFQTAQRLGMVLDEDAIANTMIFRDRLNALTTAISSFSRRVISELTPAFTALIEKITTGLEDFAEKAGGFDKLGQDFAKGLIDAFILVVKGLQGVSSAMTHLLELTGFQSEAMAALKTELSDLNQEQTDFNRATQGFGGIIEENQARISEITAELKKMQSGGTDAFDGIIASLEKFKELITKTPDDINNLSDNAAEAAGKLKDNTVTMMGSIKAAVKSVTVAMETSFTDFFNATSEKFMDFKNLATSLLKMIITQMTKMWVVSSFMPWLSSTRFGKFLGMEGKASGGTVTAGKPYMVGEKGAELFVPNQTGTIVPNNQVGGGGANINVSFNITAWDSKDATQAISQQASNIVSIVENSFRRRGQILGAT